MDGTPHTHRLLFEESTAGWTAIRVQYGDQPRHYVYTCWPGWRSRVRRVAKRMISRHDRHSLKAGRRASITKTLTEEMALWERSGHWGRDVLTGSTPLSFSTPVEAILKHEPNGCWSLTGPGLTIPHWFTYHYSAVDFAKEHGFIVTETPTQERENAVSILHSHMEAENAALIVHDPKERENA